MAVADDLSSFSGPSGTTPLCRGVAGCCISNKGAASLSTSSTAGLARTNCLSTVFIRRESDKHPHSSFVTTVWIKTVKDSLCTARARRVGVC